MRKTFRYRLYPTRRQQTVLRGWLDECRWLYNHFLEVRKTSYEATKTAPGLYDQQKTIPALKKQRPSLATVHSQVLQNVAVRIDLAFQAFFRRVKVGEKPGYPRFRGVGRYDSITFPQVPSGCVLEGNRLKLSKIGTLNVILHRPLEGTPKTCVIKRSSTGKWSVCFSCEVDAPTSLPKSETAVGIDVGLHSFATLSTNEVVENPRSSVPMRNRWRKPSAISAKRPKVRPSTPSGESLLLASTSGLRTGDWTSPIKKPGAW
jgi:putative transposase